MLFRFCQKIKSKFSFQFRPVGKALRCASLTVESALVLPIFFLGCLTLICLNDAVAVQVTESLRLANTARAASVAAGLVSTGAGGDSEGSGTSGASSASSAWIDLSVIYPYSLKVRVIPLPPLKLALRARVYPWIGMEDGTLDVGDSSSPEMVYVTDNESVYHTHADCTHLDLTIIETTRGAVSSLRNADGRRYRPCDGFPSDYDGPVYVTARGRYYYPTADCGPLTRHVRLVSPDEVKGLHECERCASKDLENHDAA